MGVMYELRENTTNAGVAARYRTSFIFLSFVILVLYACSDLKVLAQEFTRAGPNYSWNFPKDHGQHPEYETEWWYYTGQLYEQGTVHFKDKPRFGFQLTFFRKAIRTAHGVSHDYMAHAAVTDLIEGKTIFESRMGGGELGLSGTSRISLRSWSGDWSVDSIGNDIFLRFAVEEQKTHTLRSLRLQIRGVPHPWLQGAAGLSKKSDCEGCASMYYTLPRLNITAQYITEDSERVLTGIGWMDHEFMTNLLSPDQAGWDWMGLMLRDGRSVMVFRLRSNGPEALKYMAGGVHSLGSTRVFTKDEFTFAPLAFWSSSRSGAVYPISWRIQIPAEGIDTIVSARVHDCEVGSQSKNVQDASAQSGITYWEGPVASDDESVLGYLEMTGYAGRVSF